MTRLLSAVILLCSLPVFAAAPPGTKLTVQVDSVESGKPIDRASVIVRFRHAAGGIKIKKTTTSWETKTNEMGSVTIPEIPMGEVEIQIIADHYQTFGNLFQLTMPEQTITIKLNPPQAQYSEDSKPK